MTSGIENLTITGIPAHPLIVHALVVGIPVMALAGWLMLAKASWRASWAWPVAVLEVLLVPAGFLASATGQGLNRALGTDIAQDHVQYGEQAPWFILAMAGGAVAYALLRNRGRAPAITGAVLLVGSSAVALVWIILTGHSGASATWSGFTL